MIRSSLEDAVRSLVSETPLAKFDNIIAPMAVSMFYSAEEGRGLQVKISSSDDYNVATHSGTVAFENPLSAFEASERSENNARVIRAAVLKLLSSRPSSGRFITLSLRPDGKISGFGIDAVGSGLSTPSTYVEVVSSTRIMVVSKDKTALLYIRYNGQGHTYLDVKNVEVIIGKMYSRPLGLSIGMRDLARSIARAASERRGGLIAFVKSREVFGDAVLLQADMIYADARIGPVKLRKGEDLMKWFMDHDGALVIAVEGEDVWVIGYGVYFDGAGGRRKIAKDIVSKYREVFIGSVVISEDGGCTFMTEYDGETMMGCPI